MTQTKVEKKFDCLEFKQQAQELIYQNIQNLSLPEQIEYFRVLAESSPLGEWWKYIKNTSASIR